MRGFRVCEMHGARGGAPEESGTEISGARNDEGNHRALEATLIRAAREIVERQGRRNPRSNRYSHTTSFP